MIRFTKHAKEKFAILRKHKVFIPKWLVLETVTNPDLIDQSRTPIKIAQKSLDSWRVLRVVYKERKNIKIIITFYPGKKIQYEKQ